MIYPMKFNPSIKLAASLINDYLECNKEKCAWYCQYPNGEGECAIRSLPAIFEGLIIAGAINRK